MGNQGSVPVDQPASRDESTTLAEALEVIARRRGVVLLVFASLLVGTVAVTAVTPSSYESTATIVALNEREMLMSILRSERFAADVAEDLGWVDRLGGGDATAAGLVLLESVTVVEGSRPSSPSQQVISITASWSDPGGAADIAGAYVRTLDDWRPFLEGVTRARNWQKYYEAVYWDETTARSKLDTLVNGMGYYETLDSPRVPASPAEPKWGLNLALGVVLGAMFALATPFVIEGIQNALRQRAGRLPNLRE